MIPSFNHYYQQQTLQNPLQDYQNRQNLNGQQQQSAVDRLADVRKQINTLRREARRLRNAILAKEVESTGQNYMAIEQVHLVLRNKV